MEEEDRERLAAVFKGVSHPTRIAVLESIRASKSMTEIAEELDVTRGTVQDHMERLLQADLLYRPDTGERTYDLTPLGSHMLSSLEKERELLVPALDLLEDEEETVRERFNEAELPVDERTVDRSVHTEKWRQVMDELADLLEE